MTTETAPAEGPPSRAESVVTAPVDRWLAEVSKRGYAILDNVSADLVTSRLGRASEPELLVPRNASGEQRRSLSRTFGLGPFPWHTDGAIALRPPRWIVLSAVQISSPTHTDLLDPSDALLQQL